MTAGSAIFWAAWIAAGVPTYAITMAYLQRECPERADETAIEDVATSLFFILGGPLWLIEIYFLSGRAKHGLLWRPLKFQR